MIAYSEPPASRRGRARAIRARLLEPISEEVAWPRNLSDWLHRIAVLPFPLFLESARPALPLGRFSFLTADPSLTIISRDGEVFIRGRAFNRRLAGEPLTVLAHELAQWSCVPIEGLPPFQGGAAGLLSYELAHHFETLPRVRCDEFRLPDLAVGLFDWTLALDHAAQRAWIIATGFPELDVEQRRQRALRRLSQVTQWLHEPEKQTLEASGKYSKSAADAGRKGAPAVDEGGRARGSLNLAPQYSLGKLDGITSNFSYDGYLRAVARAIEYIHAGDVYQVNLAQRLLYPLRESPITLYARLRERNAAPFAAYLDGGDFVIASASPERFLRVQGREVETRPIKGTRPRWPLPEPDMYSAGELRESEKDRAENVMIVDLLRNDLGRVCEYGSVRVTDPLRLESYQYVHHLVSEVRGRLRSDCGAMDLLRAAFPGGSVTGAPKIRAMEIIAELEPTARGPYCGSMGYIGFDGSMDTNILIRTFTLSRNWIQFPVGGGIVAQSYPEREYEETLHKAEGMIRALREGP